MQRKVGRVGIRKPKHRFASRVGGWFGGEEGCRRGREDGGDLSKRYKGYGVVVRGVISPHSWVTAGQ